jgi:hypothetical protein
MSSNIEKHDKVRDYLHLHSDSSDRQVARAVGVSATFVGKVRRYLEGKGQLRAVDRRQGADGKSRRRRRTRKEIEEQQAEERKQLLQQQLRATLAEVERNLQEAQQVYTGDDWEAEKQRILEEILAEWHGRKT